MATNFPQTLGPDDYVDPYAALIEAQRQKLARPRAAMYTPEQVQQRRNANDRDFQLGLLGQLSGDETLSNVGAHLLRQAMAARQPRVTERGVADPISGQFTYDPEFLQQREEAALSGLEQRSAQARAQWTDQRQRAAERAERQREHDEAMREMRRASREGGQVGAFQQAGFTPDGQQVVTNSKSGINYVLRLTPDGSPNYIPYSGVFTPKATFEKNVTAAQEAMGSASRADALLNYVENNPEAFGVRAASLSALPGPMQGYGAKAVGVTSEQLEARARVLREAALEINQLYGAALSAGESARASTFVPNAADPPETLIAKLKAARDWARNSAALHGPGVTNAAQGRSGGASGSWGAGDGGAGAGEAFKGFSIRKKPGT